MVFDKKKTLYDNLSSIDSATSDSFLSILSLLSMLLRFFLPASNSLYDVVVVGTRPLSRDGGMAKTTALQEGF